MLDLVRGYFTTSMALYPDEKRTWQELHHILLLQQMLKHFLKGWPVLFVLHLDSKVAHSDTVWILHLLQITEHSFTYRQGFINVNGAQVYKLRLVYCPNINRLHRFPLLGCDISWIIRDFRCDIWHCTRSTEFYNFLRERGVDVSTSKCVFAGGGSLLLRGMIERGNKVAFPIFIEDIHANARGYELLYQSEVAANGQQ